ncbi:FAD-dependent oxidoreductase [Halorubrum ejinorense]|uniref:FAD-dependent oxidoreductase n=2 Tax=Halorubrum ejinorense TaxID=425309 RepID=A0ABV4IQK7_9EURY
MTSRTIGIIGSGIAGCSMAYQVGTQSGEPAEIVVLERAPEIGGRIKRISVGGQSINAGGKYIHSSNELLLGLANTLGLKLSKPMKPKHGPSGIWNGHRFVVRTDGPAWRANASIVRRYGLSILRIHWVTQAFLRRFRRVYRLPVSTAGFETPTDLLHAIGLDHLLWIPGDEYLRDKGISDRAIDEFVSAITRNFYAQNASEIHAFACLVALVGGGTVGSVYTVDGGTIQFCQQLLERSNATVKTDMEIRSIEADGSTVSVATDTEDFEFDVLCIAAPLEPADISIGRSLEGVDFPEDIGFVRLESQFVAGECSPEYFGSTDAPPGSVVTTADSTEPFYDLHRQPTDGETGTYVFALASREPSVPVTETDIFYDVTEVQTIPWNAYPEFTPRSDTAPFRLHPNVYYINAMEPVISAMETQVIASRNVWNLMKETD